MRRTLLLALATASIGCATLPHEEAFTINPSKPSAKVGEKIQFSAEPAKKDTFMVDFIWTVTDTGSLYVNMLTGEAEVKKAGVSEVCAAPFHHYLPLGEDQKTVDRNSKTGIKLIVGMGSLKKTCYKHYTSVP